VKIIKETNLPVMKAQLCLPHHEEPDSSREIVPAFRINLENQMSDRGEGKQIL